MVIGYSNTVTMTNDLEDLPGEVCVRVCVCVCVKGGVYMVQYRPDIPVFSPSASCGCGRVSGASP